MSLPSATAELQDFLVNHGSVASSALYRAGMFLKGWRIKAFIGGGGNAEVYCVVREADGLTAAAKVLVRTDAASEKRFRQEVELLAAQRDTHFATLYESGEDNGRPYLICELLQPAELPETDRDVAAYLLELCGAVSVLHRLQLIHRDIKPSNVMRRATGELVLIDFGLVKDLVKSPYPEADVSLVSGKAVAVGTPRFAAPEQLTGGEITPAVDIYALGRLADAAFRSHPPRVWMPIIRRATSANPAQRYPSVEAFAGAVRCRYRMRNLLVAAAGAGLTAVVAGTVASLWDSQIKPRLAWHALCEPMVLETTVREPVSLSSVAGRVGKMAKVTPTHAYREVRKHIRAIRVRLNGEENCFSRPLRLDSSRDYFIEGPGLLSADIRSAGGTARLHLKNCFLFNRSTVPVDQAGIQYVFEGGAYLNFTEQDEVPHSLLNRHLEGFDGAVDLIRFRGPLTPQEVDRNRERSFRKQMGSEIGFFLKKDHFPCHIIVLSGKYKVDDVNFARREICKPAFPGGGGCAVSGRLGILTEAVICNAVCTA